MWYDCSWLLFRLTVEYSDIFQSVMLSLIDLERPHLFFTPTGSLKLAVNVSTNHCNILPQRLAAKRPTWGHFQQFLWSTQKRLFFHRKLDHLHLWSWHPRLDFFKPNHDFATTFVPKPNQTISTALWREKIKFNPNKQKVRTFSFKSNLSVVLQKHAILCSGDLVAVGQFPGLF